MIHESEFDFGALHARLGVQELLKPSEKIRRKYAPFSSGWLLRLFGTTLLLALGVIFILAMRGDDGPLSLWHLTTPLVVIGSLMLISKLVLGPSVLERDSIRALAGYCRSVDPISPEADRPGLQHRRFVTFITEDEVIEDLLTPDITRHPLHPGDAGVAWIKGHRIVRFQRIEASD